MGDDHATDDRPEPSGEKPTTRRGHDRGASIVEYALLVALIAVVCIGAVSFFGGSTRDSMSRSTSSMFIDS